jgi:cytochrome c-type biogenesis protein CcmH/NrfF
MNSLHVLDWLVPVISMILGATVGALGLLSARREKFKRYEELLRQHEEQKLRVSKSLLDPKVMREKDDGTKKNTAS